MDYISENYTNDKNSVAGHGNRDYTPPETVSNKALRADLQTNGGTTDAGTPSSSPSHSSSTSQKNSHNIPNSIPASLSPFELFAPPPKKKRRKGLIAGVAIALVLVLGLAVGSLYLLFNYDFVISQKGSPGDTSVIPSDAYMAPSAAPAVTPTFTPSGNSATLEIDEIPQNNNTSEDGSLSFADIYAKCINSVVSITATSTGSISMGTGIIMSEDGYIITNNHIISGSYAITVTLQNDMEYTAALVGADSFNDLAVLKIEETGLTAAEFGNSDSLRVGDVVVAIGNPTTSKELRGTMTDGIISAINRNIEVDGRIMTLIQTNAALNSGNSGGPLINIYGQVIGINIMKFSSTSNSFEGLGFAIPISVAKPIIDELIEYGYIAGRPAIGITAEDLNAAAAAYYRVPQGIIVQSIDERSHAYDSGLQVGDVIVAIDGTTVTSQTDIQAIKNEHKAGDTLVFRVYRDGGYLDISIMLSDEGDLR